MEFLRHYVFIVFNLPSTIYIMILGLVKIMPKIKKDEIKFFDSKILQEEIKKIADPMIEYRDHINWIFWILLALIILR